MTWSTQARAHLNFEMGVNPETLSMTELHGVMGQNTHTRASPTTIIPNELSVRPPSPRVCMSLPQPQACLSAAPVALQLIPSP